jgi:hypothetical protein
MATPPKSSLKELQLAFAAAFNYLLRRDHLSQAGLGRALKAKKAGVADKTLSNISRAAHPSQIDNFAAIADHFDLQLWTMFVKGLPVEFLEKGLNDRLVKLVDDYVHCDDADRMDIEKMAARYRPK